MSYGYNPILENVDLVDITADFKKAVGENKFAALQKILKWLENRGYQDPILFGGALRDLYIGERMPRDFDCETSSSMKKSGRFVDRLIFKISDVEIDLTRRSRDKREEGIRERVLRSDAPINAIAMSADGKVLAHPDFVRHAKDGVYEIREDLNNNQYNAARTRYERLSKAYPDWALVC